MEGGSVIICFSHSNSNDDRLANIDPSQKLQCINVDMLLLIFVRKLF